MKIVIPPHLNKSHEKAKATKSARAQSATLLNVAHFDENITNFVTNMRNIFDPCHCDDNATALSLLLHQLPWDGDRPVPVNDMGQTTFEEGAGSVPDVDKAAPGSSKLRVTEAETKSHLCARPGLFFNFMYPLEGPIRAHRPENDYRMIMTDVDPHVLFANCEFALDLLSQPWCSITERGSCFLRALMNTDIAARNFARSMRLPWTDP